MARKSTRRDFLAGSSAAEAPVAPQGKSGAADIFLRVSRWAMACEFQVCLPISAPPAQLAAALEALDLVETIEAQLSIFRPDSALAEINRRASSMAVEVEPRLFALLETAMQVAAETAGAFDITVTPLWEAWGFANRTGRVPTPQEVQAARERVGFRLVELMPRQGTVRFVREGVKLNLGAIGKGYALDRCAEQLAAAHASDFLLSGGYSSMLARGFPTPPTPSASEAEGWWVGIRDPLRPDRRWGELRLRNCALATSGVSFQSFCVAGKRHGHVLDPRSGQPAEGVISVTVIAPTATLADAYSTAFFVLGVEQTAAHCAARPELAAIIFTAQPGKRRPDAHLVNLPPEAVRRRAEG
jgi:thiamine biosynthesis lipoprotein